MGIIGKHAVTAATPSNVLLGAGTFHKNLKFEGDKWTGDLLGATSGGGKISIVGEFVDLEVDGALVRFKGQTVKQGGTATMEVNFVELSTEVMKMATLFAEGESNADGFTMLEDKAHITDGDYLENFGFVGYTADGTKRIIVIFGLALCTSGLEVEAKNKEQSVVKLTLQAVASNEGALDTLPVKIYYPDVPVV